MSFSRILRAGLIATVLAAPFLGAGFNPASAQTIEATHAQGTTELKLKPETVLAFDLAALDILDALGVPVHGVPKAALPAHLAKYEQVAYEKIGTLFEPNYEAVNATAPDLIIVGDRSRLTYAELSKIAPTVDLSVDQKDFLENVIRNIRLLGRIFDKEALAEGLVTKLEQSIAEVRRAGQRAGTGLIVLTTGGKVSAFGPGSRFGLIHDALGVEPAAKGLTISTHGQPISAEFIFKTNPDWLFVLDRDAAVGQAGGSARQVLNNDLVAQTTAWKKDQVVYLDPANWYLIGAGATALQASVDQIGQELTKR
ncbi:iron complex transport system substrate-binding protein [Microvirga lupini]|uniref:Iron complex transport system substrate-binding protein n=1 Tax=Microvirga lupini TaxID=420324 RepID=A0A7W4VPV1_9HYPH|nr:siderophore ABC transporter substrate-binding protein [Microvirga lupini]MBB3021114.1 iron complex transport system substrate-binding protein [Microvirga lupini]